MKNRLRILSLTLLAVVSVASLALAQPWGRGPGAALAGIPPEKQEQVAKLYAEGRQKLYELESRKWDRQAELNALLAAPKADSSKIESLAKEIGNLSSMAYQERVALQQRIAKETGVNLPLVGGYGPGGRGGCPYLRSAQASQAPCCAPGSTAAPEAPAAPGASNPSLPPCCQQ